jgi:two-component system heavy metal sensor histidine kinase CusS
LAVVQRRLNSIAVRLALWYGLSAFALVLVTTGSLYWALTVNLNREDALTLENHIQDLRLLLAASPQDLPIAAPPISGLSLQTSQQIFVRLIDGNGATLFETPGMAELAPSMLFPVFLAADSRSSQHHEMETNAGRHLRMVTARATFDPAVDDPRQFQLAVDRADEERFLREYRDLMFLILVLSVVACAFGGMVIARRGMRPIDLITRAARDTRSGTLNERLLLTDLPSELAELGSTFNDMLDRLEDTFGRMSQFSADVAHELRTPITNMRGEIEVALGKTRTPAEYQDVLGSCLEEYERLTRIIQSLLFLAKAETAIQLDHRDSVDLRQTIAAVIDFYETAGAEASVALQFASGPVLWAGVDRTLVQQAVGNLISNAIAHSPPGGVVTVALTNAADSVQITVSDTGSGIAPQHLPHVFDRFYRADRARTGSTYHVGLGLTLVRSIAGLHNGNVGIESAPGQGTCVTLKFPLVRVDPPKTANT